MKKLPELFILLFTLTFCLGISSCKKLVSYDMPPSSVSLYEIIKQDPNNFSYFRTIIDRAGLSDLYQNGQCTVFAPTTSAFLAAGYTMAAIQATSIDSLQRLVKNHVVAGKIDVRSISSKQELTALSGEKIIVQKIGNAIYVDGSDITNPWNQDATNGILNVINKLLVAKASILERVNTYSTSTTNASLSFLSAAITRASEGTTKFSQLLGDPAADYTFFAPNNGAFIDAGYTTLAKITGTNPDTLAKILNYHLVQGRKLVSDLDSTPANAITGVPLYFDRIKPSTTTLSYVNGIAFGGGGTGNMLAGKGVIHVVSRFLPAPITTTTLDRIKSDTTLSYFNAAVTRASQGGDMNYASMLSDAAASYTVFAVNNQGFRNAGYKNIDAVNNENPALLRTMLKFHLLNKRQNSINYIENGTAATLLTVKTATGTSSPTYITITKTGGYKVKGPSNTASATVNPGDVVTTNGILNVINNVLLP